MLLSVLEWTGPVIYNHPACAGRWCLWWVIMLPLPCLQSKPPIGRFTVGGMVVTSNYSWVGVGILGQYQHSVFFLVFLKVGIGIGVGILKYSGIGIFLKHYHFPVSARSLSSPVSKQSAMPVLLDCLRRPMDFYSASA